MKRLALFDFDGTITNNDHLLEMIRFSHGTKRYVLGMAVMLPQLLAYKLGWMSNQAAKERVFTQFYRGWTEHRFATVCEAYCETRVPRNVRPKAAAKLKEHQSEGHDIYVVTAAIERVLKPWCDAQNLALIGTTIEVSNGIITGKLASKNCFGEEKVNRVKQAVNLEEYDFIYAYGDTPGDKPMLGLADEAHYQPFRD